MKSLVSLLLALCMMFSFSITAFAENPGVPEDDTQTVEPRWEETEWVYRVYNGNYEKRLWSYTYGVWRTDWIIVGPYPGTPVG